MTVQAKRRRFDPARDAHRFVFVLDEDRGTLFEIVGLRGLPAGEPPKRHAAVKVLDVAEALPDDPFVALDEAAWIPLEEARVLAIVEPIGDDG